MVKEIIELAAMMIETDMVLSNVQLNDYDIRPILERVINAIVLDR